MFKRLLVGICIAGALNLLSACESSEERAEKHFQTALEHIEAGDIDRAIVEFRNVFKLNGRHEEARLIYAGLQRERGVTSEAYGQYLRLVEQYPENFEGRLALAEMALETGNWDEAERHGRAAAELNPDDPGTRVVVANLDYFKAAQNRDTKGQRASYDSARALLAESPGSILAYQIIIEHLMRQEDWPTAREALDAAITLAPDQRELHNRRLGVLNELGDHDAITAGLRGMVDRFPDDINIRNTLLNWHMSRGETEAAEAFLRDQIDPDADAPDAQVALVQFLIQVHGPQTARAELDQLLATEPAHAATYRALRAALVFDAGETEAAIAEMERLVGGAAPSPDINDARITLARMLVATDNPVGARAQVEEVLANDLTHVDATKLKAGWLIEDDQTDEAIALLRGALGDSPRDAELMTLLANAHERSGNPALMADMLALAVEASGSAPQESLRYAAHLARSDREIAAEGVLLDALRLQPENIQLLNALGTLYIGLEDWGRSQGVIDRMAALPDGTGIANELTAQLLNAQGRQEALTGFLERLAAENGGDGVRIGIIRSLLARDNLDGALDYVEEALRETPDAVALQNAYGAVLTLASRFDEAEDVYRAVLDKVPTAQPAWLSLHRLKLMQGDRAGAAEVLDAALTVLPDNGELLWARAEALQYSGDIDGAIAVYETLYERNSDNLVVANNLASLLSDHSDDAETLERAWRIARRLRDSTVPAFRDTYGWITFRRGNHEEALSYLEPAAEVLQNDPIVQYHLAAAYAALGRNAEALAQFTKVQDMTGDDVLAEIVNSEITRLTATAAEKETTESN